MSTAARCFKAKVVAIFVAFVTFLKHKASGSSMSSVESSELLNSLDVAILPDMELSKAVQEAIQSAAMKAKLLFDTYHWTWSFPEGSRVPTVKEIVGTYTMAVDDVWQQAMKVENGVTVGKGNMMAGRLTCEFVDEEWSFGIMLSTSRDFEGEDVEREPDEHGFPKRVLANARQLNS